MEFILEGHSDNLNVNCYTMLENNSIQAWYFVFCRDFMIQFTFFSILSYVNLWSGVDF